MTPYEVWQFWFGGIEPVEFWRLSEEGGCQQADEAVGLALAGMPPFHFQYEESATLEEAEILSEFLARCIPGLPADATGRLGFP